MKPNELFAGVRNCITVCCPSSVSCLRLAGVGQSSVLDWLRLWPLQWPCSHRARLQLQLTLLVLELQCVQAATSLVKLMVEDFVPSGFVPYFPELVYVHSAFASVVLLKVRTPTCL